MSRTENSAPERRRLIESKHRKRSLGAWLVPLVIILVVIYLLPRLAEILD